ncbi:MAG: hypothetical protein WBD24_02325 [Candidatus Omnitrophota bacterium]
MEKQRTRDEIDLELSRTYFGGTEDQKSLQLRDGHPRDGQDEKAPRPVQRRWWSPVAVFLLVLWMVSAIMFFAGYFFRDKRVVFNVSINVEKETPEVKPAAAAVPEPVRTGPARAEHVRPGAVRTVPVLSKDAWTKPVKPEPVPGTYTIKTLYDFEIDEEGWEIPAWELEKADHVARSLMKTGNAASNGSSSLELAAEFPGTGWSAALVEVQQFLDLKDFDIIEADLFLPLSAPEGLRAKLIITIGETWKFVEMTRSVRLIPGEWTTIRASFSEESRDWKRTQVDDAFKSDIRKIAIRVESNGKPAYSGPIYIDHIRISSRQE